MSEDLCAFGIYGLTSIGQQLAAHHAANKVRVCVCDEDPSFVPQVIEEYRSQWGKNEAGDDSSVRASRCMIEATDLEELAARVETPRKIIVFGTYSEDDKLELLWKKFVPYLESGDMVLRWGREENGNALRYQFYSESIVGRLTKEAQSKDIHLLEMVRLERDRVSEMKSNKPDAFFVGGSQKAYLLLKPLVEQYAITGHIGDSAACAHYGVMIQRAIEFAVTQTFAEGVNLLKDTAFYENSDLGRILNNWNDEKLKLHSYLTEISSRIAYKRDKVSGKGFVTDKIIDAIDIQASDAWTRMEATRLQVPVPTLNAALDARYFSTMKDERIHASKILKPIELVDTPSVLKEQICDDLQNAIYCSSLCAFAEGLSIFQAASEYESWNVNIETCIDLWNLPGSFLTSNLLKMIDSALSSSIEDNKSLLTVPDIAAELDALHMSWRRVVTLSFACGTPIPCLSSALTSYDSYRSDTSPAGLIRAQRDFFGGYGYDRFDQEGWFSTQWTREHTELKKKELAADQSETREVTRKRRRKTKSIDQVESA
ncbi:hypothetical protein HJC23_009931 [Cyclotella cryptica]|uniref:6-phosphogluconate dehydrogenase, decarboxylating n=1 Tax=Cyclotella cryptica TaxID=29204 RepID=A0ABD3P2N7_9STRA|eukprot:CCRYP_018311-RA/>CCRYP_018311-RA protein AED:0.33 eAED:0.33 QI:0/-1/0/1/-1/1/1/0/541